MIALISILVLGILILVLGGRLVLQSSSRTAGKPSVTFEDYSRACSDLDNIFLEAAAIERIFATEDMKFISQSGPASVQHVFREERKALALLWLRRAQKQLAHLMDLHLRLAAYTHHPSPRFEMRLATQYVSFLAISNFVFLAVWLRGPFETTRIVGYTIRGTGFFCTVFRVRLENINPIQLVRSSERPAK